MKNIIKTFAVAALMLVGSASAFADVNIIDPTSKYDLNGDNLVDFDDVAYLLTAIDSESEDAKYDLNGDGLIDFDDLAYLLAYIADQDE